MALALIDRPTAKQIAYWTPDARAMASYSQQLGKRFKPGEHFTNADVHRVVWPQLPVGAWIGIHRDHLAWIIDTMEDAGYLCPSFGPRGGDGWSLAERN